MTHDSKIYPGNDARVYVYVCASYQLVAYCRDLRVEPKDGLAKESLALEKITGKPQSKQT